jgi:hypothetical protein
MLACLGRFQDHREVESVGDDKVNHLDRFIVQQVAHIFITLADPVALGQVLGPGFINIYNGGDFHRHSLDLPIAAKMEGSGKSRAYDSDFNRFAHRNFILSWD